MLSLRRAQPSRCGAPKPQRRAQRRPREKLGYKPVHIYRHTDIPRVLYYDTPANRINLDGDALLVGSDDANDVRHETLPHRGPHQAIAVAHLVLRDLVAATGDGLESKDLQTMISDRNETAEMMVKRVWPRVDRSLKTLLLAMEARFSHDFKDKKEQFKAWVVELIPELADDAAPPSKY